MFTAIERGPMKLKHLAALVMLLAVGCSKQPASDGTAPATDSTEPAATSTVEPETETQLASTTVSFNVTGMQ
jgi:type IV pilus biogenesis protein CpaD/CtpE